MFIHEWLEQTLLFIHFNCWEVKTSWSSLFLTLGSNLYPFSYYSAQTWLTIMQLFYFRQDFYLAVQEWNFSSDSWWNIELRWDAFSLEPLSRRAHPVVDYLSRLPASWLPGEVDRPDGAARVARVFIPPPAWPQFAMAAFSLKATAPGQRFVSICARWPTTSQGRAYLLDFPLWGEWTTPLSALQSGGVGFIQLLSISFKWRSCWDIILEIKVQLLQVQGENTGQSKTHGIRFLFFQCYEFTVDYWWVLGGGTGAEGRFPVSVNL